jgi:hypothetical protein
MWSKSYKDYQTDQSLTKNQVAPGRGLIGCEMHDLNGWGETNHHPKIKSKQGIFAALLISLFSKFAKSPNR